MVNNDFIYKTMEEMKLSRRLAHPWFLFQGLGTAVNTCMWRGCRRDLQQIRYSNFTCSQINHLCVLPGATKYKFLPADLSATIYL